MGVNIAQKNVSKNMIDYLKSLDNGNNKYNYYGDSKAYYIFKDNDGERYRNKETLTSAGLALVFILTIISLITAYFAGFSMKYTFLAMWFIAGIPIIGGLIANTQYSTYKKLNTVIKFDQVKVKNEYGFETLMKYVNNEKNYSEYSETGMVVKEYFNILIDNCDKVYYYENSCVNVLHSKFVNESKTKIVEERTISTATDDELTKNYKKLNTFYNINKDKFKDTYNFEKLLKTHSLTEYMSNKDFNNYKTIIDELVDVSDLVIDNDLIDNTNVYDSMDSIVKTSMKELNSIISNIGQNQSFKSASSSGYIKNKFANNIE